MSAEYSMRMGTVPKSFIREILKVVSAVAPPFIPEKYRADHLIQD